MEKASGLDARFARRKQDMELKPIDPGRLSDREYLRQFAAHPGMFIGCTSVRGVTRFLNGYDYAAPRSDNPSLDGFRDWLLATHLRRDSSFAGPGLIRQIALPEWDLVTDLSPEQEACTLLNSCPSRVGRQVSAD
ncbi:hypothetical protein [Nocardia asteroides]|uniref:hypothetical protein n=1 Tax=Nocardia asteroides TaxID=1824 RepID=UPI00364C16C3